MTGVPAPVRVTVSNPVSNPVSNLGNFEKSHLQLVANGAID
jgi:hypothetical protein